MDQYIECPICEERFDLAEVGNEKIISCPACQRKFMVDSATVVQRKTAPRFSRLSTPVSFPANQASNEPAFETQPARSSEPSAKDAPAPNEIPRPGSSPNVGGPPKSAVIRSRTKRRQKKRLTTAIVSSVAFAIIAGVLGGILFMQVSKTPTVAKQPDEDAELKAAVAAANAGGNGDETNTDGNSSNDVSSSAKQRGTPKSTNTNTNDTNSIEKTIRYQDLPPEKLRFYSKAQLDKCWDVVRPYLVSLKIHNARGTHDAVGTIIDSRGWIVTSYRAVKGASKIEVVASPKSVDELDNDLLQDEVRGIVTSASDPENDIAVLSINRRFVVSFADIKKASFVKIVSGAFLSQSMPPSKKFPYGRREIKVQHRDRYDALEPQDAVRTTGLTEPATNWVVTDYKDKPVPGTPVTTIDGELAAINVFADETKGYYVLIDKLDELIANADEDVEPLLELGGGTAEENGMVEVNEFHPILKEIQSLNQAGEACVEFDWIATTNSNYDKLQEFGNRISAVAKYIKDNPNEDQDVIKPVKETIERWDNTIAHRFFGIGATDKDQIKEMNRLADRQLKKGGEIVPFFGEVTLTGVDLVDREMHRFFGLDTNVTVPFDPKADPRLPGKQFLFFVSTVENPESQNFRLNGDIISTYQAKLNFDSGPLNE